MLAKYCHLSCALKRRVSSCHVLIFLKIDELGCLYYYYSCPFFPWGHWVNYSKQICLSSIIMVFDFFPLLQRVGLIIYIIIIISNKVHLKSFVYLFILFYLHYSVLVTFPLTPWATTQICLNTHTLYYIYMYTHMYFSCFCKMCVIWMACDLSKIHISLKVRLDLW
jgi:hypothetical protein